MTPVYKRIRGLMARAARAPSTPLSSVTESDTDPEEGPPDYNHHILTTPESLEDIVPARETVINIYFKKLNDFSEGQGHRAFRAVLFRRYVKFLYLKPVMDPDAFIFVTRHLLDLADTATFLTLSFCNYMALGMKKMTKSNFTITYYLNNVRRQLIKAMEFVERAAEELRAYKEEEQKGETSGANGLRAFPGQA
ncbi:hypothetical protein M378DRAFT_13117 [Amanita muscaria Koide BX008]|uniref:Uncharacterized protein n=1 Tax=Amanita muscaria (strain Koide BX008) TaxID=946122 RepID=A0A0C2WYW4_AMAMK|nr:hypothetical protein M378DRAFT_13117 [Amanita muscaria Koide BX008]